LPRKRNSAKYWVKIALVVAYQQKSPFARNIFLAVDPEIEKENTK
jgi:hypothetical protein